MKAGRRRVSSCLGSHLLSSSSSSLRYSALGCSPTLRSESAQRFATAAKAVGEDAPQDVVIAGGGAIGSSVAYFLASNKSAPKRITVIEKDPTYRYVVNK